MVEDDRIFLGEADRALELVERFRVPPLLVVRPAQAVDEVAVLGIQIEGALDELHRLGEVLAAFRVHVADEVVRLGVLRIEDEYAPEGGDRVVEASLLLVDDTRLEDEVLVLVVEAQPLLEGGEGAVVLLGAEVGGAEVEEELGPLRLDIHRLLEEPDRLLVALGAAVEEGQLHPGIHRAGIGGEDLLQLNGRLGVPVGVHESGGEEVARPEIGRLDAHRVLEGGHRAVPFLLLVVDGAELDPDARVPRRGFRERLHLLLRFLEPTEPHQHVTQPLHEGDIVRIRLEGLAVDLERLLWLLPRLVHEAQSHPRSVHVAVELDGPLQPGDRLVPLLALDGHAAQQMLGLRRVGLDGDQPQQDGARLVVLALLDVLLGEGDVRLGRLGRELYRLLELAFGVGEAALPPEDVREGEVGRRVGRLERDGLLGRLHRFRRLVGPGQPLRELHPESRRVAVAVDSLAEGGNGLLVPPGATTASVVGSGDSAAVWGSIETQPDSVTTAARTIHARLMCAPKRRKSHAPHAPASPWSEGV